MGWAIVDELGPLVFLFERAAPSVVSLLSEFIAADDQTFHYEGGNVVGPHFRLLNGGVEYLASVGGHSIDIVSFDKIFVKRELSAVESTMTLNLGENVGGGQRVAPIVQSFLEFAAKLAAAMEATAVAWLPSRLMTDADYFVESANAYFKGGAFPVLPLVKFEFETDIVRTVGLDWFAGQEITLKASGLSQAELMRRTVRMVHDIAVNGPLLVSQYVPDLVEGQMVRLNLSADGRSVDAEIISDLEHVQP